MADTTDVKDKKKKQIAEKNQIRRWILKSVAETTRKTAVTLNAIKKFLDSKQNGISGKPDTKLMIKRLLDSGHLIKVDGRFSAGKPSQKKSAQRYQKRSNEKKLKSPEKGQRKIEGKRRQVTVGQ
ncbi:uncharacterized protein NPIL_302351 [Nephila pilipes]|uniref:H15 domain-containing protein n=1 Tax=Nephila pilipes TaxID=299642 RepID=A0A8X6NAT4_NEPPI|nr:uncharacterized protein NPIL_171031 [Nephila pilipes]GFT03275.1 uncharacterized protein NPIL_63271 [Nephila pilipes]GFT15221.1 uncharacterized protein NPIL_84761 [Nephila pilipes]GFT36337.1 uncharacterized protein NPIL_302351 [Nephila pilipes]